MIEAVRARLEAVSETPSLDAQVLLSHILGRPRAWVLVHSETTLSPEQTEKLEIALRRLEQGEPLPYILGHWEFFGLDFTVTPATLIPRPETELLVECALGWLGAHPECRLACDLGTGSGCIAVSLAVHVPDLRLLATDLSRPALSVARRNAQRHAVGEQVAFILSDLFPPALHPGHGKPGTRFDLICANLPYVPTQTLRNLKVYGREPDLALDGGQAGLDLIARLLAQAPSRLAPGGLALIEIEAGQGNAAYSLARQAFPRAELQVLQDLAGRDRLVEILEMDD